MLRLVGIDAVTKGVDDARQVGALGLALLLGKRRADLEDAVLQDVLELVVELGDDRRRQWRAQANDETVADVPRRMVDAVEGPDLVDRDVDAIGNFEEAHVDGRDETAAQQVVLYVALPRLPVRPARGVEKYDRHRPRLAGLHERQRLEPLVVGAEAAREEHDRVRFLDEHQLAREEVLERDQLRITREDRKSTRLNSSHRCISYAV